MFVAYCGDLVHPALYMYFSVVFNYSHDIYTFFVLSERKEKFCFFL